MTRKGILLAGGNGTRLFPSSASTSKHLLPIYDKPMIYYSLSTLMLADIQDILIICNIKDLPIFRKLFTETVNLGINFSFAVQKKPLGVAHALVIAENFIGNHPCCLILGDNFFYGHNLSQTLKNISQSKNNTIIGYPVNNPSNFGVVEFDYKQKIIELIEKPVKPTSRYAITGIYFLDNTAPERAKKISKSKRNELEIVDVLKSYHKDKNLNLEIMGQGDTWLDAGCHESLIEASLFVRSLEYRQGFKIGCPEEIAWRKKWISKDDLLNISKKNSKSSYSTYLHSLPYENITSAIR